MVRPAPIHNTPGQKTPRHSCLYEGTILHRRFAPFHQFQYSLFLVYLDLDELHDLFRGRWLWSARRFAPARFRREDHFGDPRLPLKQVVADLVESRLGFRPQGSVRLLTNLRYFGHVFNPVSFYYCYDGAGEGERLEALVAEVHNTPWGETHCYVLDLRKPVTLPVQLRQPKEFHVSPFMDMNLDYQWRIVPPDQQLDLAIENWDRDGTLKQFEARLLLRRTEIATLSLTRVLARYPLQTIRIMAAIYWQAFRLWRKQARYYPHPPVSETISSTGKVPST